MTLGGMLIVLPAMGVVLAGKPLSLYLEFPPESRFIAHAPFSWPAFIAYTVFVLGVLIPIGIRLWNGSRTARGDARERYPFPWWGWVGLLSAAAFWILAWTRMPWFSRFQPHTFFPLWLSYIIVVNALGMRRNGRCLMLDRPRFFLALFPFSAAFWWFFEYLNRFVQNWYYSGVHYGAGTYFLLATLSFSTVLPAVLSTQQWMAGASRRGRGISILPADSTGTPPTFSGNGTGRGGNRSPAHRRTAEPAVSSGMGVATVALGRPPRVSRKTAYYFFGHRRWGLANGRVCRPGGAPLWMVLGDVELP